MKKLSVMIAMLLLIIASSAFGFNGMRKGFILGGGAGFAPASSWSGNVIDGSTLQVVKADENRAGFGANFYLGYGWDEHNLIVFEGNGTAWDSKLFDKSVSQGYSGAAWYHYFGRVGHSAFTNAGLGFYFFHVQDYDANNPGVGVLLGAGYEFARHWQVGGYLAFGRTSDAGGDFDNGNLNILVSATAF